LAIIFNTYLWLFPDKDLEMGEVFEEYEETRFRCVNNGVGRR
jgi:hypothetical protein